MAKRSLLSRWPSYIASEVLCDNESRPFNPLNAELNPTCHFLHYQELTIFSTLAEKGLKISHKKCSLWPMQNSTQDCNLTGDLTASAAHCKLMVLVPCVHNLRWGFRALLYVTNYYKHEWNAKWARNSERLARFSLDTFSYLFQSVWRYNLPFQLLIRRFLRLIKSTNTDTVRLLISCFNQPQYESFVLILHLQSASLCT